MPPKLARLMLIFGFTTFVHNGAAQTLQNGPDVGPDERLEAFFTRLLPVGAGTPPRFTFTLHFLPSFHPESRIVVSCGLNSVATVYVQTAQKSIRNAIAENDKAARHRSVPDLARAVGLRSERLSLSPEQAWRWFDSLLTALSSSANVARQQTMGSVSDREVAIQLDGTLYATEVEIGQTRFSTSVVGSELETALTSSDAPIIRAMTSIRTEAASMLRVTPGR
jgi:hypothetical protein